MNGDKIEPFINLYFYLKMLPSRALVLIHDYSRPMTRSNWRKSKPIITTYRLYTLIRQKRMLSAKFKLHHIMILNNIENTDWFYVYNTIQLYGIEKYKYHQIYCEKYHPNNLQAIDGIPEAIKKHKLFYDNWY